MLPEPNAVVSLSTEGRLAATLVVALVAVALVGWAIPVARRRLRRLVADRSSVPDAATEVTQRSVAWLVLVQLVVRSLQLSILGLAGLAVLLVWGRTAAVSTVIAGLARVAPTVGRVFVTAGLVALAWLGSDLLERSVSRFGEGHGAVTEHQETVVARVAQLGLFVAVMLLGLTIWSVDLDGLLVGAGFLGIVVGLAARQTLGAFIAGFVLMFSRPFEIGDWVVVDDNEGIVTEITVMNTQLRNFDGEFVMLPNDRVNDSVVINRTREGRLRLRVEVGVDYDADPERAEEVALDAIDRVDEVVSAPPPQVIPTSFGNSAVVLELRFWIDRPIPGRKWAAIRGVVHEVKSAFDEEGIKIPFPQRELSGRAETGGFRVVESGPGSGEE